jgi:hypothetical protein
MDGVGGKRRWGEGEGGAVRPHATWQRAPPHAATGDAGRVRAGALRRGPRAPRQPRPCAVCPATRQQPVTGALRRPRETRPGGRKLRGTTQRTRAAAQGAVAPYAARQHQGPRNRSSGVVPRAAAATKNDFPLVRGIRRAADAKQTRRRGPPEGQHGRPSGAGRNGLCGQKSAQACAAHHCRAPPSPGARLLVHGHSPRPPTW